MFKFENPRCPTHMKDWPALSLEKVYGPALCGAICVLPMHSILTELSEGMHKERTLNSFGPHWRFIKAKT